MWLPELLFVLFAALALISVACLIWIAIKWRTVGGRLLGEVCDERGTMKQAALVVDTDATGFFQESERNSLEFCLREFGSRLKLEIFLHALIAERETRR